MDFTVHQVLEHHRLNLMRRKRQRLQERSGGLRRLQVVIIVVIGGEIDRKAAGNGSPVTGFVGYQLFILESGIAHEPDQNGDAAGPGESPEVYNQVRVVRSEEN